MATDKEKDIKKEQEVIKEEETKTENDVIKETDTPEAEAVENPIDKLTAEKEELNDRLMRLMAEFDNFRKRTQREKESTYLDARSMVFTEFLPVIDNFERALASECSDEAFKKGVEMIYTSLMQVFEKNGVESFGKPQDQFDPNFHHAVMHIEDDTLEENIVIEVFQKGYKLGDKILRCAMVKTAN